MPSDKTELAELRALARKRQRAVGNKISRLKGVNGVVIAGTLFDPRRAPGKIKRYNAKQLKSLISSLDTFMDRGNQFVGDYRGNPLPQSDWKLLKKYESEYNKLLKKQYDKYKDVYIEPLRKTVDERRLHIEPKFPHMQDNAVNAPYKPSDKKPHQIVGKRGLKREIDRLKKLRDPKNFNRELRRAKIEFQKMVDDIGDKGLERKFKDLSPERLHILWNYTNFATSVSLAYIQAQRKLDRQELADAKAKSKNELKKAHDLADWAATFEFPNTKKK